MLTVQSDKHYMSQAILEARTAYGEGEIPVGAVVVSKSRIIAKDHNRVEQLKDATAHAELLTLTVAQNYLGSKYLNECTLYVTLEPCVMCGGALFWTQIGKIVVSMQDLERGFRQFNRQIVHPKTSIEFGLMEQESEQLIKDFFRKLRRN